MHQHRTNRFCFFSKLRTALSLATMFNIFMTTMMYLSPENRTTCSILSCLSEITLVESSELGLSNLFNTRPPLQTAPQRGLTKAYGGARCMLMTAQSLLLFQKLSTADAILVGSRIECMLAFMLVGEYLHRPQEERPRFEV